MNFPSFASVANDENNAQGFRIPLIGHFFIAFPTFGNNNADVESDGEVEDDEDDQIQPLP